MVGGTRVFCIGLVCFLVAGEGIPSRRVGGGTRYKQPPSALVVRQPVPARSALLSA